MDNDTESENTIENDSERNEETEESSQDGENTEETEESQDGEQTEESEAKDSEIDKEKEDKENKNEESTKPYDDIHRPEGRAAFEIMKRMLRKKRKVVNNTSLPSCLYEIVSKGAQKKFPCTICGKLFVATDQLIVHSHEHGQKDNPFAECCFCGLSLNDTVRLRLHQLASPIQEQCTSCMLIFADPNDLNHHSCKKRGKRATAMQGYVCKLGCSKDRIFESEESYELHLFSLHGASMDDDPSNNDAMKFCIMCKGFVNAYRLSLEDHTYFRCNGRHPWVKQTIHSLYNLAKDQSLNLAMLIKLELECQLEEWKARDALRGQTSGIIQVPKNVNKEIVLKCLGNHDKKYNPEEAPFLLPPNINKTNLGALNPTLDTIKIFHLWNQIVQLNFFARRPTEEASVAFYESIAEMMKNINARLPQLNDEKKRYKIPQIKRGKMYSRLSWDDAPPADVLKRLEKDLGKIVSEEAILDPRRRDQNLLKNNYIKMSLRDLEPASKEDMVDPSDFLQIESSA